MLLKFDKYQGAGNDFIIIDSREIQESIFNINLVKRLCDRHFGIGADGLILLRESKENDFRMKYFNSDGKEGTMCGNGGRCIVAFANNKGLVNDRCVFDGIDGVHEAMVLEDGHINLKMKNVEEVKKLEDGFLLDTGSLHFVQFRENIDDMNVATAGRAIRRQQRFGEMGTNVNFVMIRNEEIFIRTYERGVEDETLACGTGVVASAICSYASGKTDKTAYEIQARGGKLKVNFDINDDGSFKNVWLTGPAKFIFEGKIKIKLDI